ncbi:hypothetical protein TrVE_jg8679 [Triparma verrucosa]|uniref:Uncharacterized protein n=1 Tax=Triparma verrucosa TaxID=1606542 RepID=A0A9W7B336_9STRA|nr:hypothetical protein TrVE_jg8679 [Triparma verrucosa]
MFSNDAVTRQMKALGYREMLDAQLRDNGILKLARQQQASSATDFDSSYQFSSRLGGGGEPIRRADGSIVANLRTLERTANANLPFDRVARPERGNYSPTKLQPVASSVAPPLSAFPGEEAEIQNVDLPASNNIPELSSGHKLFNHSYDSPEEKESLSLRRQRQRELRRVLEDQIREKEERRTVERRKKQEEKILELEQMRVEMTGEPLFGFETEAIEELHSGRDASQPSASGMLKSTNSSVGGANALNNLLNSPIRTKIPDGDYSSDDEQLNMNNKVETSDAALEEAFVEKQEALLRTIKDQSREIEQLTQKLQGIEEGRVLFYETLSPPRDPDSFVSLISPIKSSFRRSSQLHKTNEQQLGSGEGSSLEISRELRSSSEYLPLGSSPALITTNSFSMDGFPLHSDNTIVSSNTLQSSFGLTAFQKTFNLNQYENRKEEALESFLRAFQQGRS